MILAQLYDRYLLNPRCLIVRYFQDDWDSDFDDESVSQVGGPGGAPAAAAQNNYAQHQVKVVSHTYVFFY
jgi:hypothetical protein